MNEVVSGAFASPLTAAATIIRFVAYLAALLAAGGMLFISVVHDRRLGERRRLARAITLAATVAAAATLLSVGIQGALLTGGGVAAAVDRSVLAAVFASAFGTSALVRVGALAVLAVAVRVLWRHWAVALGLGAAVVVTGSFLLTGHTLQAQPGWLAISSGLTHTLAAAAWFGGLVLLGITMRIRRGNKDAAAMARVVSRFSTVATIAVIVVSIAGAARVTTLMPVSVAALDSEYGLVLVTKVLAVAAIFLVAGYNHRYLVPAVSKAGKGAQRRLRATVRAEGLALVVVMALSAVLVNVDPPGPAPDAALPAGSEATQSEAPGR